MPPPSSPVESAASEASEPSLAVLHPVGASDARLPLGTILTYCLPTVGCGFMFLLIGLYLMPFSTDVLGISPAVMGTLFGLSRIWDAVSDPLAGYWSDRTRSRMGRRSPWESTRSMWRRGDAFSHTSKVRSRSR